MKLLEITHHELSKDEEKEKLEYLDDYSVSDMLMMTESIPVKCRK